MNWADDLLLEYSKGREQLKMQAEQLGDSKTDNIDRTLLNSMNADMAFVVEWLETGRQPGTFRGADVRALYQIQYLEDMDLIPDIAEQLAEEREELHLEKYQKEVLIDLIQRLSERERQCFIRHVGQKKSMAEVGEELGISKSSVQEYLIRTREKVDNVVRCHTKSI